MKKPGAITVAYLLLGLLILATLSILLGTRESSVNPSPRSFGPSGTSAFVTLARDLGYRIESSAAPSPARSTSDLLVLIPVGDGIRDFTVATDDEPAVWKAARQHVRAGGTVLILPLSDDFPTASRPGVETITVSPTGQELRLRTANGRSNSTLLPAFLPAASRFLYTSETQGFARIARIGQGWAISLDDGAIATNRLIDQDSNAAVLADAIGRLVPKGGRVIIAEAVFNQGGSPGLLETLGPWAEAAWRQVLVLFAVIIFTLGVRFGIANEWRRPEMGQRQLVDAIGETYRRAKTFDHASSAIYKEADRRIRSALRLPAEAPDRLRDDQIDPKLREALATLQRGADKEEGLKESKLLEAARVAVEESARLR